MIAVRPATSDARLVAAYRAGDPHAFDEIHARHHARLERYARRILAANPSVAEDVVQEAMIRASRALRRDERPIELRPWLFRLVRNCALDELSRVRGGGPALALDDDERPIEVAAPDHEQPAAVADRRAAVRELLDDLAALPEVQRHVLVRREVDGLGHAEIAGELGLSEQATKSLAFRARANLVRHREARDERCEPVRRELLEAATDGRRAPAQALRHVAGCPACRAFRSDLQLSRRAFAVLDPGILLLGLGAAGLGAKALTAKGAGGLAGKGAGTKLAVVAASGAAAAGIVVAGTEVFGPGDPAPVSITIPAVPRGALPASRPLPAGSAVVRRTVVLPAGAIPREPVAVSCPAGLRVADLLAPTGTGVRAGYAPGTRVGVSATARVRLAGDAAAGERRLVVSVLCRRPAASGSIRAADQRSAAVMTHRLRVPEVLLRVRPGGPAAGSVVQGQPVRVLAGPRRGWLRVETDGAARGWIPAGTLEPVGRRLP